MNKTLIFSVAVATSAAFMLSALPAIASSVDIHVGAPGVIVQQRPVYVEPQPVYVQPRTVYVEQEHVTSHGRVVSVAAHAHHNRKHYWKHNGKHHGNSQHEH